MHIYFVGLGGTGIGPLAIIAHQAGYTVSGSDKQPSNYLDYVKKQGVGEAAVCQDESHLKQVHENNPVDWVVATSAAEKELKHHPILEYAQANGIKVSKRDEFLSSLLKQKNLKLIAISGTHGKTTTTAMVIWLFRQLGLPVSYSVGAKMSFVEMGKYDGDSEYFVYECDEYDRNFLSYAPAVSLISGIDYDHADVYPTREDYYNAFKQFIVNSLQTIMWKSDADKLGLNHYHNVIELDEQPVGLASIKLPGLVNRRDARLAMQALAEITDEELDKLAQIMNDFPGVARRFEQIAPNIYSDYAHTPDKIRGALGIAEETAGDKVTVVYEGLHNTRQHFIKDELKNLFTGTQKLYVVPSYLAREDESLEMLTPHKLCQIIEQPAERIPSELNDQLKAAIENEVKNGNLVLCLSAGGGGSLDEWLRVNFKKQACR